MSIALVALVLLAVGIATRFWRPNSVPGPKSLPLIGNWRDTRGKPLYLVLTRWSQHFGDFFSYRVGSDPVFVVTGIPAFDELFNKKGTLYNSRPSGSELARRVTAGSRGVALPYGEPWKQRRRVLQNLLTGRNAKFFLPYQDFESKILLLNLLNDPANFYQEAARYSSSVTFSMLLGARFESSDAFIPTRIREEMILFWQHLSPGAWLADWIPFLDYLPEPLAPWRKKADWMHDRWVGFWSLFFDRMNERYKAGIAQDCFLTRFLAEPDADRWSQVDSVGIVAEILSAGSETTITSVQWFFRAAIYYPEAIRAVQEEIDAVVGRGRLPQWENQENLPYVTALVEELHRWASVSPLGVAHATTDADVYRGHRVHKGATVIANLHGVHHDPGNYPLPEEFIPGRFLPPDHPKYPAALAGPSRHFAFGVGRRACPGVAVANASLYIVISRIIWGFNISAAPSGPPNFESIPSPLVVALAPFECTVTPRDEKTSELIRYEATSANVPGNLESASVYNRLVEEWDASQRSESLPVGTG